MKSLTITSETANTRLDICLARAFPLQSRSYWQKLIKRGDILINNKSETAHIHVCAGDIITIAKQLQQPLLLPSYKLIHQAENFLIIDKPAQTVVHPDSIHPQGTTLIDAILRDFPDIRDVGSQKQRPGIVHRLDKNVSGVMVIARTNTMYQHLKHQFAQRTVVKQYIALVHGHVKELHKDITIPITRSSRTGKMVARNQDHTAREAYTSYVLDRYIGPYSLLNVQIHTGRTHQIRVHLYAIGHPVVGDTMYASKRLKHPKKLSRIFLHSHKLGFQDTSNVDQKFISPLPEDLTLFLS